MIRKGIVDLHTHILPCMDDGSASPEESRLLLRALSEQGVDTAAATPHFYADRDRPADFFERRRKALGMLSDVNDSGITILPGAEVCFYQGISRTKELPEFTIGTSGLLLLEMPFYDWTSSVVNEVISIQRDRKIDVVIAHIDRYNDRKNAEYIRAMLEYGVLFQINASAFLEKRSRADAMKLLKNNAAHFIASDCHNMTSRPPRLGDAYDAIEKKIGEGYLEWLIRSQKNILG